MSQKNTIVKPMVAKPVATHVIQANWFYNMGNVIPALLIIAIMILLFLLLREVVMWYWKINERIKLLKETNDLLAKLLSKNEK